MHVYDVISQSFEQLTAWTACDVRSMLFGWPMHGHRKGGSSGFWKQTGVKFTQCYLKS